MDAAKHHAPLSIAPDGTLLQKWWSTIYSPAPATPPALASGPACVRMTPAGTPIVGPTRFRNLYLNTGHGTLGWTMACGSAKLLSDLISDIKTEIPACDLSVARY